MTPFTTQVAPAAVRRPGRSPFDGGSISGLTGLALTASAGRPMFSDDS